MNHAFEDIEIKANGPELLKKALKSKKEKVMIGTGAMTDPYIPLERKIENVRESLELIYKYGHGFTCITKSNMILRDLDLLKKINEKSKAVVQMTLTTYDEDLCKILEPNVCTTKERVKVLKILNKHNIPTVVWLCPILPFINDTEENINVSPNHNKLMKIFYERTNENNIMNNADEIFEYLHKFPSKDNTKQTTLF